MNTKQLFFALWPDDRQRERLRDAISPVAKLIEGRAAYRGDWHVTLAYIGDFPADGIPALLEAAGGIEVEPFRLRFDRAEYWIRPKIAVLSAQTVPPELERLVESLHGVMTDAGVVVEAGRLRPHITIVRRAKPFETQRLARPVMVEWSGFELVESSREPGRAKYRPLKQ